MTRAEIWLIVCAAGDVGQGAGSWYAMVSDAVEKAGAVDLPLQDGTGRRHANGTWPTGMSGSGADDATEQAPLPDWTGAPARSAERQEQPLSPSKLGGAKALFGEDALDEGAARQKGIWLHLLLEHLPKWPRDVWPDIAAGLLSMEGEGPGSAMIEPLLKEVIGVVDAPDVQDLFAPSALVEVELTARLPELGDRLLHGTIDRLLVTEDSVRLVDFKSNAIVPERPEDVPEGILRQMGAYAAMLERIYPGRRIDSAILWTRTGRLMPLDAEIVRAALRSTTIP